jgi:hypothetical protein
MTDGFDVLVQLVMAAMTTEPWLDLGSAAVVMDDRSVIHGFFSKAKSTLGHGSREARMERLLHFRQRHAILRTLRPGERWFD